MKAYYKYSSRCPDLACLEVTKVNAFANVFAEGRTSLDGRWWGAGVEVTQENKFLWRRNCGE